MDEKTKQSTEKAQADRAKFESIKKVEIRPVITRGSRGKRQLKVPDLRSPDEKHGKWRDDPEDLRKERAAKKPDVSQPSEDKE